MPRPVAGKLSPQLLATRPIGDQPARVAQESDAVSGDRTGRDAVRRPEPTGRCVHSHGVERRLALGHAGSVACLYSDGSQSRRSARPAALRVCERECCQQG